MRRRICIVTGTRAEYGLLYWLMKAIQEDDELELQLICTGMHLSPRFGLTYREIETDGFTIDARVEMLLSSDTPVGTAKSVGLGIIGFSDQFSQLRPDVVVVLGDRFEILAAAAAALFQRLPLAHIHGGEISAGAYDESIRHAVTKMSHLHFVAAEPYRKRVIQLGEAPERVHNVGALGIERAERLDFLERDALERELGCRLSNPLILVTYHPETLGDSPSTAPVHELLSAVESLDDATVVFTYPNSDSGNAVIIDMIDQFVSEHSHRASAFVSLGQRRYLSLMRIADVVVGNSSSAITEAPALKTASVNIGGRQNGRLMASSVISVEDKREQIVEAVRYAMSSEFRQSLPRTVSLYGSGEVSAKILAVLKAELPSIRKPFLDIHHEL